MSRLGVNVISESVLTVKAHGVHTAFLECVRALRASGEVDVVVNRPWSAYISHVHTVGPYGVLNLLRSKRSVVTAHVLPDSLVGSIVGGHRFYSTSTRYLAWYYNLADAVIALDEMSAALLQSIGVHKTITVIPNALDLSAIRGLSISRQRARLKLGLPLDALMVLAVGQFQPRKGVLAFLQCASLCPDALYVWVGGNVLGPLADSRRQMRNLAENRSPNVIMPGLLPRERVFDYYSAADMFFLPSWYEDCSMAVLEAAAMGLPILVRDLPQHRSLLGGACLYADESGYVEFVREILSDQVLRTRLGSAARSIVEDLSRSHATSLLRLYRQL